ncbi:MAG: type I restriction endonuclease subunit R [Vulcanimicrobiaceae bacterium]
MSAGSFLGESEIEEVALSVFSGIKGYRYINGSELSPDGPSGERLTFGDAVLHKRLHEAVMRLNDDIDSAMGEAIVRKVVTHESTDLALNNRRFHQFVVEGVPYEYRDDDGSLRHGRAKIIDLSQPDRNEWLVVNQITIKEHEGARRPDVVVFCNGLPIGLIEFKDPTDENASLESAYNQLQTYKSEIPLFCAFNEFMIISDGVEARLGTITSDFTRFQAWRSIGDKPTGELEFTCLAQSIFDPARCADILRYFILFEQNGPVTSKKIAAYHQYRAANKAIVATVRATQAGADRRIGVVWHTQGSGKSLTMVFYAAKVVQRRELDNPTLVVITDRNDLDGQLHGQFARCEEVLRQKAEQAKTREELHDLLNVAAGGIIFTTIQKFFPEEKGGKYPELTARRNVIVIADEAHRSQYDMIDGFARHMRDALPNASFIGFTGTPIEAGDRNTRSVFGNYVDTYDIRQSVEDKATVPIYYEARTVKLRLKPEEVPRLDPTMEEITEGEEEDRKRKVRTKWASLEALVGAEHRISEVARDLVAHFEERLQGLDGKAMVACMSRRICVELYDAIVKIRPAWASTHDSQGSIKVVMTGSAADGPEWQQHIRTKHELKVIENRFKDPDDPLKIVLVRDMWLTGFDVPALHTLYMDKPMRGHALMQAIARVNRVFKDKPGGLVVDYLGLADDLKKALATYAESGGAGEPFLDEGRAVVALQTKYEVVRDMYHGFDYRRLLSADAPTKIRGLIAAADFVLGLQEGRSRYLSNVSSLSRAFALASTSDYANSVRQEIAFFQAVRAKIAKTGSKMPKSNAELDSAVKQLISEAVASEGIVDILSQAGVKNPDISILSDDFLLEVQGLPQKNLARELLERLLRDDIKAKSRTNVVRARKFSEMLQIALKKYEDRSIETTQLIMLLIEIAKEIRKETERANELGLSEAEVAFYDALAESESAVQVLGDKQLRTIAEELVKTVRQNVSLDWTLRETAKANIRRIVKRILNKYGYPPDAQQRAVDTVLEQAELFCANEAA